ncbi:hypothetical protein PIROE2DRAFT_13869 [Piromyces sp. E2]|nr:hypothetical protein PIROE2DRAFT_13869 [Piromyces sp. E2]|eukprot:OUM60365.1 hypothetical protein PIROE2DRAFT_13869 [Piromyces sp. E2]
MIELHGTVKERFDEAIRLSSTKICEKELDYFRYLYDKAQIPLLPSAEEFYKKYGGVFRHHYLVLSDPTFNREIFFTFYTDYAVKPKGSEKKALTFMEDAMENYGVVKEFAKQDVCPVADIGYYYPPVVYVGENGLLYCVFEYQEEIEVYHTPSEIFAEQLKNNIPIGIEIKSNQIKNDT